MEADVAELRAAFARNLASAMEVVGRRRTHVADEAGISRDLLADALRERVAVGLVQLACQLPYRYLRPANRCIERVQQ
jgi:hypothetical protein